MHGLALFVVFFIFGPPLALSLVPGFLLLRPLVQARASGLAGPAPAPPSSPEHVIPSQKGIGTSLALPRALRQGAVLFWSSHDPVNPRTGASFAVSTSAVQPPRDQGALFVIHPPQP
ncbi:hypothetical protein EDB80DRAFT_111642 [Ilyonectria destructans]|nr:hypothetical protein EDB80DRAFT_111642 [Ilyonectria destructans]